MISVRLHILTNIKESQTLCSSTDGTSFFRNKSTFGERKMHLTELKRVEKTTRVNLAIAPLVSQRTRGSSFVAGVLDALIDRAREPACLPRVPACRCQCGGRFSGRLGQRSAGRLCFLPVKSSCYKRDRFRHRKQAWPVSLK